MPRPFKILLRYTLLMGLLLALWLTGCSESGNDNDPKVAALAKVLGSQINSLTGLLKEPLSQNDPKAVEEVLARFYLKCSKDGQNLENSVIVLDEKGVTFAVRNPAPGHPEGIPVPCAANDYSSYHIIKKALKSGRTEVGVVYLAKDSLYVVCHPVGSSDPVGVLILGILGSYLEARIGVSGQEFLNMQINS